MDSVGRVSRHSSDTRLRVGGVHSFDMTFSSVFQKRGAALALAASLTVVTAAFARRLPNHLLRVCADPADLPFSDSLQQGFENKIAVVIAHDLGDSLTYVWWPNRRGFIAHTLRVGLCDVLIEAPTGYDIVLTTNPYYRSTYYFVTRRDKLPKPTSLDDPMLRKSKIGISMMGDDYATTPPGQALAQRGLGPQLYGFLTYYGPNVKPGDIIDSVASGELDMAIVWGPIAGYFAKRAKVPLDLAALPDSDALTGFPFAYDVALGVRITDPALRDTLNQVLVRRRADIDAILRDYEVPTLPLPAPAAAHATAQ